MYSSCVAPLSERVNTAKPVLSATPAGGAIGGQTPVQPDTTVHSKVAGVSPESTYTVWLVAGAMKPGVPNSVAVANVVAAGAVVGAALAVAVAVGTGVGAGVVTAAIGAV